MFVEKYKMDKWQTIGYRIPEIGEYILCYDQNFRRVVNQVDSQMNQKAFILKKAGE
jgi:hypothetical protein